MGGTLASTLKGEWGTKGISTVVLLGLRMVIGWAAVQFDDATQVTPPAIFSEGRAYNRPWPTAVDAHSAGG